MTTPNDTDIRSDIEQEVDEIQKKNDNQLVNQLRELREGDQFISTGGDGCAFTQHLKFLILFGGTLAEEMQANPQVMGDKESEKILLGLEVAIEGINHILTLPSQYDVIDRLIDRVEACDAERSNLLNAVGQQEAGGEAVYLEDWKKDGSLPFTFPSGIGRDQS